MSIKGNFPSYKTAPLDGLIPYARNSRTHSEEQVAQIAASIREFGFTNPVLVDGEGGIIAGHGRVMAARKLGMKEVPVIVLEHLTDAQRRNGMKDSICEDCGAESTVRKDTSPRFCRRCASVRGGKATRGVLTAERSFCKSCGDSFRASTGQTYCSVACRSKDARTGRVCKCCGGSFQVFKSAINGKTNASGNFCSRTCYEKFLCRTDRVTGRGSQWRRVRDEAVRRFPFCGVCGTREKLQVHHIIPFRLTRDNSQANLIPLCTKHHRWVETMFVETEAHGVTAETSLIWRNMLRSRQAVVAAKILDTVRALQSSEET